MILFKPEHVAPILASTKTQTRRMGKKRWNVGAVHQAKTRLFGVEPFAHLRILEVRYEMLGFTSEADARAEGYATVSEFVGAFLRINGMDPAEAPLPGLLKMMYVWVVRFELAEAVAA